MKLHDINIIKVSLKKQKPRILKIIANINLQQQHLSRTVSYKTKL